MSADLQERASDEPSEHKGPSAALTNDVPSDEALARARSSARPARTGLPLAIGLLYLARLLVALIASYPVVASVSASGVLAFEAGVGKLFEPGGLYLLEVLLRQRDELIALIAPTAVLLVAGALAAVAPEWLLLRALGARAPGPLARPLHDAPHLSRERVDLSARRALPRLGALALASWAGRGLLIIATAALAMTVRSYFVSARDERLPLIATGVVVLLGLFAGACLAVLHDLATIEVTLGGVRAISAVERALATLRRHPLRIALHYAGWMLATAAVLLGGAALASSLDVSSGDDQVALAALVLHQTSVLGQLVLHAGWLGSALAASHPPAPRPPDATRVGEAHVAAAQVDAAQSDAAQADAFL